MKNLKVFLLAMFLVFSITGIAGAVRVNNYDGGVGLGTWTDVNKANVFGPPDSALCWAASASNALAWTSWRGWDSGTSTYISTAAAIYATFDAGWTNRTGNFMNGIDWWFTTNTANSKGIPLGGYTFDTTGKGFYTQALYNTEHNFSPEFNPPTWPTNYEFLDGSILGYINDDRAISITVVGAGYMHNLTVWGLDLDNGKIYLTDSDDGMIAEREYGFTQHGDNYWYIDDYVNLYTAATDFKIIEVDRLNINAGGIEPNKPTGPDGQIPEPTTILLIGSGLIGLWGARKKFKK
jgi:hypothetical protein